MHRLPSVLPMFDVSSDPIPVPEDDIMPPTTDEDDDEPTQSASGPALTRTRIQSAEHCITSFRLGFELQAKAWAHESIDDEVNETLAQKGACQMSCQNPGSTKPVPDSRNSWGDRLTSKCRFWVYCASRIFQFLLYISSSISVVLYA